MMTLAGVRILGPLGERYDEVLTPEALAFLLELHRRFNPRREELLQLRQERQRRIDGGEQPDFLPETRAIRESDWQVAPCPVHLRDRRVEITGPVDRKMIINGLNSGARVFMADFEDATTPTWANLMEGQINLIDAVRGEISHTNPDGRTYRLKEQVATLFVRPRGLHLPEAHLEIDSRPAAGSLVDFGLYLFHNARQLLARGSGPYFYLPKLESHLEARLWNQVFGFAQEYLGIPQGSIKATVLIETILAAFEMDEILYELREHSVGLNAGRWDYLFSCIKSFRNRPEVCFPDRTALTMTIPFMRAYTQLLVKTCHRRGAHAMGGMAAFIPNRRHPEVTQIALAKVREDKLREATDGCDGTWVAHPDLVPIAAGVFDELLGDRPNQIERQRPDLQVMAADLLAFEATPGAVTEAGLRLNINVGIQYIESWLRGVGAAAIHNLMEDAATAEISRSQVWQWVRQGVHLPDGRAVTEGLVRQLIDEEMGRIHRTVGPRAFTCGRFHSARLLFEQVSLEEGFPDFLTVPGYAQLISIEGGGEVDA